METGHFDRDVLPPAGLTAASFHDPALEPAIAASAPNFCADLLAEADRRTTGDAGDREVAFRIFCALADRLGGDSADAASRRAVWTVDNALFVHPGLVGICDRAMSHLSGERRAKCVMIAVRALETSGRAADAWNFAMEEFRAVRGTGCRSEALVALGAARVASGQNAEARVLAFTRRGIDICSALDDRLLEVQHLLARSAAYESLNDGERTADTLAEIRRILPRIPEPHRRTFGYMADARHATRLVEAGDHAAALSVVDALDPSIPGGTNPMSLQGIALIRTRALTGLRRLPEAFESLRTAEAIPTTHLMQEFSLGRVRVDLRLASDDVVSARDELRRLLGVLQGDARRRLDPYARFHHGRWIADTASQRELDAEIALFAADTTAEALLETLRRIDDEVRDVPEVGDLHPDDLDALADHRRRLMESSRGMLRSVQSMLHSRLGRGDAGLFDRLAGHAHDVTVCAWCCRIRASEGRWLPVAQHLPDDSLPSITHGICPTCAARIAVR